MSADRLTDLHFPGSAPSLHACAKDLAHVALSVPLGLEYVAEAVMTVQMEGAALAEVTDLPGSEPNFVVLVELLPNSFCMVLSYRDGPPVADSFNAGFFWWAEVDRHPRLANLLRWNSPHQTHKPTWHIDWNTGTGEFVELPVDGPPDIVRLFEFCRSWALSVPVPPQVSKAPWGETPAQCSPDLAHYVLELAQFYPPLRQLMTQLRREDRPLFNQLVSPPPRRR